ncbi:MULTISPECIES: MBL fold metallo-hydrolase [unclassified Salinibacterium]|uniref:MBL fold metallo-hydrolase n=1 Tax=unclassified Salinibacterium TaxID=2632331 RepID=UPI0018CDE543|nr:MULTISPECIES: MBL fold metallo-hydrolase [unclassified Salinibacterium]MBH0053671.1 MBL fold metallo-hydrolase [Salinibacterium sp. SWN139]MBH0082944.1 MBL fold metallo-hydrolase [Salinibacterium sp. SWN167]
MKVTKYEHACLVLEHQNERLVIDPGGFTEPLPALDNVTAIVITHQHPDHWTDEQLERIRDNNPDAPIFGPAGVAAAATNWNITTVVDGAMITAGVWTLEFFGGEHAVIHPSIPMIDNLGVLVNGEFWYGGDSFTVPPKPVAAAAIPAGAPWLKISEVMDYVTELAPKRAIQTHDAVLSDKGLALSAARITDAMAGHGGELTILQPGESITL